jgi:hypothetical protein
MTNSQVNNRNIPPFLEGVARNFDFACSINDPLPLSEGGEDPIVNDWKAVGSDYQDSMAIMQKELNGSKRNNKKK